MPEFVDILFKYRNEVCLYNIMCRVCATCPGCVIARRSALPLAVGSPRFRSAWQPILGGIGGSTPGLRLCFYLRRQILSLFNCSLVLVAS